MYAPSRFRRQRRLAAIRATTGPAQSGAAIQVAPLGSRSLVGQHRDLTASEQPVVAGHEGQVIHQRRRGNEPVRRIPMRKIDRHTLNGNFVGECSLLEAHLRQSGPNPCNRLRVELNPALPGKDQQFPCTYRREPDFVLGILELSRDSTNNPGRFRHAPQPDMRVQQQSHLRTASHSSSSEAGETTSLRILTRPAMHPNQDFGRGDGAGGTTRATGSPRRVTRTGRPVRLTRSKTARQVALNSEIVIVWIGSSVAMAKTYHGH